MMKRHDYILALLFLLVLALRLIPGGGEWYFSSFYPLVAKILGGVSSIFPFSISGVFYVLVSCLLVLYPIVAIAKYHTKKKIVLFMELRAILWLYVWFNLAWGINYMAPDFYHRTGIKPAKYDSQKLKAFANDYLVKLNESYCKINTIDEAKISRETVNAYKALSRKAGIHAPFCNSPKAKTMLLTPLYSKVGVLGSMGPFWSEFTLNGDLLPYEYANCWAHEYAHSLGIAREGEATFYAYLACTSSNDKAIRFSGYMSVLPYILRELYLTDEKAGEAFVAALRPEIKQLYNEHRAYWQAKYSRIIGGIQNFLLDSYLKSNNVTAGIHSYSEVVGLMISTKQSANDLQH